MENKQLTERIIGCAIKVHKELGPGLLESAYQECLFYELQRQGFRVKKEVAMPLVYNEVKLECGYRLDLFVEDEVIIELKSVEHLHDIHMAQILSYLKLADKRTGLLINFNVTQLIKGVKRVVNGY
ncbi:GxxExxY protein [Plebeiibacterium sediminum]|uniref:GxxExxY protein n=1 Tax=Plebeiibacterium sediminum TaxID=2992112 RepID=A0AAE3M8M8_9BACT|nr:GxxExxY protein [Plebeiobacterium sediminum]MCW3789269.1 GxxExxY protein [Plebeiobacterium sediminum]